MPGLHETGAVRLKVGSHTGTVVHAPRPPIGKGLVCDPTTKVENMEFTDDDVTCKVCLSHMAKDK